MKDIDIIECLPLIMSQLKKGVLISTKNGNKINSMTVSWGQIGIEWGKMLFTLYVRHSRFTHEQIEVSKEFTVSMPVDDNNRKEIAKAVAYCGSHSGRNSDKPKDCNLTTVPGLSVNSPAIKELPLTLECKVIYKQEQNPDNIPAEFLNDCYPQISQGDSAPERDFHTVYYGEIIKAYVL